MGESEQPRSVGEERKSLAIGLSAAVISVMSWLPGPSIGGRIVDSACLVWKKATSTSGEYCAFYDVEAQRYRMYAAMLGMRVISILFMSSALFFARKRKSWDEDEKKAIDNTVEVDEKGALKDGTTDIMMENKC